MTRIQPAPPSAAPTPARVRLERTLLVIGVIALGFNLRGAITSLPPIFPELQTRLGLSGATISILAATPVICFGVVSGFAAAFARRLGEERVLFAAIIALTAGLLLRAAAPSALLFPGTILAGAAIAVMNVLLSSLIKRRWPERAGMLIGLYITALSVGAIAGSVVSVPLWQSSGGSLLLTLGWLAAPAALAALLWLPQLKSAITPIRIERSRADSGPLRPPRPAARLAVHRHPLAWQVMLFMGLQSLVYYATLSWLPTILRDRGESAAGAGDLLALMGVGNLAVSLVVPVIAQRMRAQHVLVVPTVAAIAGGLAGLVYAPLGSAVAWALILGAGQNAALALAIFFTAARSPDAATAASLSAFSQAAGYLLASAGPLGVGLLHSATGSWTASVACCSRSPPCCWSSGCWRPGRGCCRPVPVPLAGGSQPMTPAPVGFDLDMTLIDSRAAILGSFAGVAAETGVAIDPAGVDRRLGIKLEDELAHWMPPEAIEPAMAIYRTHYLRLAGPLTRLLPGARESLAAVRAAGARAIVVTAKFEATARLSLDALGLVPDAVFGGVHGPEKAAVLTVGRRRRLRGGHPGRHGGGGHGRGAAGRRRHRVVHRRRAPGGGRGRRSCLTQGVSSSLPVTCDLTLVTLRRSQRVLRSGKVPLVSSVLERLGSATPRESVAKNRLLIVGIVAFVVVLGGWLIYAFTQPESSTLWPVDLGRVPRRRPHRPAARPVQRQARRAAVPVVRLDRGREPQLHLHAVRRALLRRRLVHPVVGAAADRPGREPDLPVHRRVVHDGRRSATATAGSASAARCSASPPGCSPSRSSARCTSGRSTCC